MHVDWWGLQKQTVLEHTGFDWNGASITQRYDAFAHGLA